IGVLARAQIRLEVRSVDSVPLLEVPATLLQPGDVARHQHDVVATRGELFGELGTDARGRSGDQGRLCHVFPSVRWQTAYASADFLRHSRCETAQRPDAVAPTCTQPAHAPVSAWSTITSLNM